MPVNEVRALTFFALVISILALILVNRSASASLLTAIRRPNVALAIVLPVIAVMLAVTLIVPFVSALFRFGPLHADDLLITLGAGVVVLVVLEFIKPVLRVAFRHKTSIPVVTGFHHSTRRPT